MAETTQHKEANAGPLGLLGFGMSTILLNLHNSGVIELSIVILAMGICMGGLAQIIAGSWSLKRAIRLARRRLPRMVCSGGHWY